MPGIVIMESEQEEDGIDKDTKIEEITSPQRSILDFFRSPTKPVEKPKNLLSYFGKPSPKQSETAASENGAKDKKNGIQNGTHPKDQGKKNTCTSEKNSTVLNLSLNEFDIDDISKTQVKKVDRKKGTKKSLKEIGNRDEASKESNEKGSKQEKNKSNKKNMEKDVIEKVPQSGSKNESRTNKKTSSKDDSSKKDLTRNKDDKMQSSSIDEHGGMDYLDFLKTLENKSDSKDNSVDDTLKNCNAELVQDSKNAAESQTKGSDSVVDVNYPSIASFFTKLSGSATCNSVGIKHDITMTTKADIHSEPTPPKVTKADNFSSVKKCSPLVNDAKLNEIVILSSEVVTVENPLMKPKNRKKGTKAEIKSARKSLEQKLLAETVEISDEIVIGEHEENKEAVERKNAFLQCHDKPVISQKTSQSTLSFVKGGLKMSSKAAHSTRIRSSECEEVKCESPVLKSTPIKRGRGRPPGSTKKLKNSTSEDLKMESEESMLLNQSEIKSSEENTSDRRNSLRKKYKVDMISIDTKNKTPIRMRLTRCNKSGSSTDESFVLLKHKTNFKQSKAQKLLEKAKKTKAGISPEQKRQIKKVIEKNLKRKVTKLKESGKDKSNTNDKTESCERRRSSRLSGKHQPSMGELQEEDEVMIIDDNERGKRKKKLQELTTPKKERKPSTPSKGRKDGTPKKPTGKLAPIFMKKKTGDKPEEPKKIVLDPEQERRRREFLMSGVPEAIKKQAIAASAVAVMCDLPPFPSIKHVQQEGIVGKSSINVWKLNRAELKYREFIEDYGIEFSKNCWNQSLLEKPKMMCNLTELKKFKQHPKIDDALLDLLLKEIQRVSPSYNVDKMYSLLKEKKEDQDAEMTAEVEEQKENRTGKDTSAGEENKEKKSTRRRSLRLKQKDEVMEIIDLGSPEPVNKSETSSSENKQEIAIVVPWTDKYQPTHSSEIVGNSNNVKKLKSWLIEWKHRVGKEARKMKKMMMKDSKMKSKAKETDDWWADDDSDFDLDSTDSEEEEEDKLCNTVMLMGPVGIGKTTTVYALAQELGFKVFEVNASSTRNGKRILSQLQEATQSHRVSHNKTGDVGPSLSLTPGKQLSPKKKVEKNLPTSFANFFKKSSSTVAVEVENFKKSKESKKGKDSKNGRKRKREIDDSDTDNTPKKKKDNKKEQKEVKFNSLIPTTSNQATVSNQGLNLASTSLILFEDVDIVFEEDKGFWSAIQTFMSTTKIPIVLTTNDVTFSSKFDGRYEQYLFKTPTMKQTTVYLQLICLAEGIRTNSEEIMTLVKVLSGDIRRCLLALQYWVDSGGGTRQENQKINPLNTLKPLSVCEDTCSQDATMRLVSTIDNNSKSRPDDDDDFVSIKPAVNKRKRPLISDDESSNSVQLVSPVLMSTKKPDSTVNSVIHLSCLNSSLGLSLGGSQGIMNLLRQLVKGHDDDLVTMVTEACDQYRKLMYNIVYNTYLDLLPLPKSRHTSPPSLKCQKVKEKKTQLKRIKTFDLYDSEASTDGILDEPIETKVEETFTEQSKEEKVAAIKSLDELTEFYDNMSFIDSITIGSEVPDTSNSFILHSKRNLYDIDSTNSSEHIDKDNLCSEIEVRALYKLCLQQEKIQDSVKNQHLESLSIPSIGIQSQGALVNRASNSTNLVMKKASNNIMSNLPLNIRCHQRSVVMDYLPTLREICKAEKLREVAKAKRRFYHYFDNIGLNLKDTTLDVMYTSFQ